jgi:hypothetical protein
MPYIAHTVNDLIRKISIIGIAVSDYKQRFLNSDGGELAGVKRSV